jgi:C-terminal processing protease CtpA/Prc
MKAIFLILGILVGLTSCEKILFEPDLATKDPFVNFDYLWQEVDKKYSYFQLKNIHWEGVKNTYRPMISSQMSEEELFEVLANMLKELKDDHTNLFSPFNVSAFNVAYSGPENYRQRTIEEFYIPNIWLTGPFLHGFLGNSDIGYLRYASFSDEFSDVDLDFILNRYAQTKGLILDLRANGGGSIFNVPKLLGRFTTQKTLVGYSITRNGPLHTDFSEREDFYVTPYHGFKYLKPVVVLIDRGSYSATTFFAMATKAFPSFTLVGDTTGGGGGLPNGGQLPNGWTYRFSVSQLLDLNGNNDSENGVAPDIQVDFNWNDLTKDEILDRAILELQ